MGKFRAVLFWFSFLGFFVTLRSARVMILNGRGTAKVGIAGEEDIGDLLGSWLPNVTVELSRQVTAPSPPDSFASTWVCFHFSFASLPAGIANFTIWNWNSLSERFALDLPTRGAVRVSELRKAVAARLGRRTEEVTLKQRRAKRRDGAVVVHGGGLFGGWFADERGEQTMDVEARERHVIEDGEAVPEAGGTRAVIFYSCLLYTSPSPRDGLLSRMPSSA